MSAHPVRRAFRRKLAWSCTSRGCTRNPVMLTHPNLTLASGPWSSQTKPKPKPNLKTSRGNGAPSSRISSLRRSGHRARLRCNLYRRRKPPISYRMRIRACSRTNYWSQRTVISVGRSSSRARRRSRGTRWTQDTLNSVPVRSVASSSPTTSSSHNMSSPRGTTSTTFRETTSSSPTLEPASRLPQLPLRPLPKTPHLANNRGHPLLRSISNSDHPRPSNSDHPRPSNSDHPRPSNSEHPRPSNSDHPRPSNSDPTPTNSRCSSKTLIHDKVAKMLAVMHLTHRQ